MADVFISFIHEEQAVASAVQKVLRTELNNQNVFLSSDEWQIFAGELWLERIKQELEPANVVVLMLSPASVKRPWVNFEAGADLPGDVYYLVRSVLEDSNTVSEDRPLKASPAKR